MSESQKDDTTGMAVRFIRQFDIEVDQRPQRYDVWVHCLPEHAYGSENHEEYCLLCGTRNPAFTSEKP